MEIIKFDRIVSVSSELQGHGAQNILEGEISPSRNWMAEKGTEKAVVILQLERAAVLTSVHVGNAHSAFVEVLVGKAADGTDHFECLIPMSVFMNPHESKTGTNSNRTRFFNRSDFDGGTAARSWDRVKVVCSQPFNKHIPFGLCFLKVHGEKETKKAEPLLRGKEEEGKEDIEIGSFFKKRKSSAVDKPLSVSQQIKEAEKETSLAQHTPLSISKMSEKFSSDKKTKEKREKTSERRKDEIEREETAKRKKDEDEGGGERMKKEKTSEKERVKKRKDGSGGEATPKKRKDADGGTVKRKKPFGKLLEDVVLVISGFKNPLRGDIRGMVLEMGAKYSGDWEPHCTHLVCAYDNTPKFRQVKGKGKIVTKEWVEKCHADRRRYPWRRFALDQEDRKQRESEEEVEAGEEESEEEVQVPLPGIGPVADETQVAECSTTQSNRKSSGRGKSGGDDYDLATDDEEEKTIDTTDYPMPYVPDFLSSKTFYLDPNLRGKSALERYIVAYNGVLTETFGEGVDFYVTEEGGAPVELFREKAPDLVAVKPSWIWEINAKQKCVPTTPHLV